jgi:peptide/nickel transport system permease protein
VSAVAPPIGARPQRAGIGVSAASLLLGGAVLVVAVVVAAALFGAWLQPADPAKQNLLRVLEPPSAQHPLGTDDLGRDVLSRVIAGARRAITGPMIVAFGLVVTSTVLGLLAGYRGGWVDTLISRWIDLMISVPTLLTIVVVAGIVGGGYAMAVLLLILFSTPYDTRVVRGAVLEQRNRPYVEAAQVLGLSSARIMFGHILPVVLPIVFAVAFLNFAWGLVSLSSLSFLGIGGTPGTPDWGRMLADNRGNLSSNPWSALGPGIALLLTATSMNLIGDWLNGWVAAQGRER